MLSEVSYVISHHPRISCNLSGSTDHPATFLMHYCRRHLHQFRSVAMVAGQQRTHQLVHMLL